MIEKWLEDLTLFLSTHDIGDFSPTYYLRVGTKLFNQIKKSDKFIPIDRYAPNIDVIYEEVGTIGWFRVRYNKHESGFEIRMVPAIKNKQKKISKNDSLPE